MPFFRSRFLQASRFFVGGAMLLVTHTAMGDEPVKDTCTGGAYNDTSKLSQAKVPCSKGVEKVEHAGNITVTCKEEGEKYPKLTGPRPTPPLCYKITGNVVTVYYSHY